MLASGIDNALKGGSVLPEPQFISFVMVTEATRAKQVKTMAVWALTTGYDRYIPARDGSGPNFRPRDPVTP